MEVFIAFLLLVGAFTLGATTSHSDADKTRETVVAQAEQSRPVIHAGADHRPCRHTDGPLVQRDLTVPRPLLEVSYDGITEAQDNACSER